MNTTQTQEVINWAIDKIKSYDSEKKLYNISAIILSVLDVVCGIIAIFYTSMIVTSVLASIACGTIWSGRFIQLVKTERLAKSLRVLSTASIAYIAVRKKRSEYMKKILQNIKNNPLTIIFAVIGGGVMAFVTYSLAQLYFITLPQWLYIIFAIVAAIITIALVFVLGWDTVKSAILRSAKKSLSDENYNKVVEMVGTLEAAQAEDAKAQAETVAKSKEVEQAKITIANYEARLQKDEADKVAYEKAKALVAETQANEVAEVAADVVNDETPKAE